MEDSYVRCPGNSPSCLGMVEYNCCSRPTKAFAEDDSEDFVTEVQDSKRKKLSLKSAKRPKPVPLAPSNRFNVTVSEDELAQSSKGWIPTNTARSTGWANQSWASQRNKHCEDQCPEDLLDKEYPPSVMCNVLQKFITEARREDGSSYPPKTLYQLLCGLLRRSRNVQENPPNFLDRQDVRFKKLHGTCDCIFRKLHESGVESALRRNLLLSSRRRMKTSYGLLVPSMLHIPKAYRKLFSSTLVRYAVRYAV